jgi:nucleolin
MSFEMTDRDLNALFRGIKNVIDVRVAIDRRTGQPRGFAHADFIDTKSAMDAMKVLETKETYGRKLRLDYSYGPSNAPRNQPGANRERGNRAEERSEQENTGTD